jgi:hypothetical protein
MARGLEEAHRRNSVRAYRRHGGFWMALGATAVLFGLLAFPLGGRLGGPARRHLATSSSPDRGGHASSGSGSPVSSSDFRLATTFGQP